MNPILFWIFAATAAVSSLFVVGKRSPMASALALAVTVICLAGLFAGLLAPFMFIVQLLVYAGAVIVLIVFVIMLLNLTESDLRAQAIERWKLWIGGVAAAVVCGLLAVLAAPGLAALPRPGRVSAGFGSVSALSGELFTRYLLPFEVVSLILLVGIIGAVVVAKRGE